MSKGKNNYIHSTEEEKDDANRSVRAKGIGYKTPAFGDSPHLPSPTIMCDINKTIASPMYSDHDVEVPSAGRRDGGVYMEVVSGSFSSNHISNFPPNQNKVRPNKLSPIPIQTNNQQAVVEVPAVEQVVNGVVTPVTNTIPVTTVQNLRRRYNTTSTIHAAHTITNPNTEQILFWYVIVYIYNMYE